MDDVLVLSPFWNTWKCTNFDVLTTKRTYVHPLVCTHNLYLLSLQALPLAFDDVSGYVIHHWLVLFFHWTMRDNRGTIIELPTQTPVFMLPDKLKVQCIELCYSSDNTINGSFTSLFQAFSGGYIQWVSLNLEWVSKIIISILNKTP